MAHVGRQRTQPLRQRGGLDAEDLAAAMVALRGIGRHEGQRLDVASEDVPGRRRPAVAHGPARDAAHGARMAGGVLAERGLPQAVGAQRREIDVGDRRRAAQREALRLRHQLPAIGDQPVAVPRQVGGRFPEAGGAVELDRQVLGGRHADQVAAILELADGDVRGRQVGEHGGAGERGEGARRHRRPEVLAHLDVQREAVDVRQVDEKVGAERARVSPSRDMVSTRAAPAGWNQRGS